MEFETIINDRATNLSIEADENRFMIGDKTEGYTFYTQKNGRRLLRIGRKLYKIDDVSIEETTVTFTLNGRPCSVQVYNEQDLLLKKMGFKKAAVVGEGQLKAPMPGKILEIMVKEGDSIEQGEPVAILEAMKMENELKAPISGTIELIAAAQNDSLEKNAIILEIAARG